MHVHTLLGSRLGNRRSTGGWLCWKDAAPTPTARLATLPDAGTHTRSTGADVVDAWVLDMRKDGITHRAALKSLLSLDVYKKGSE